MQPEVARRRKPVAAIEEPYGGGRQLPTVSLTDIPALPEAALYVLTVARKPNVSAEAVAQALGTDQSIALRFLSLANSSFFSPSQRITTLSHCVAWLGLEFVCSTLVILGMDKMSSGVESLYFDRTAYWQHNLGTAACCEMIARRLRHEQPEEAYVVGLTHDIGKQVLLLTWREEYDECLEWAARMRLPLYQVEDERLGLDHAMAGALALREWKFNPELVHIVLNHHELEYGNIQGRLMATVRLAHHICETLGYGSFRDLAVSRPETTAMERLRVDEMFVSEVTCDLENSLEALDAIILAVSRY